MITLLFFIHTIIYLALVAVLARSYRRQRQLSKLLLALVLGGLAYDNLIVSLGSFIGQGAALETLNHGRFVLHAALTPLFFVVAVDLLQRAGVAWVGPRARWMAWVATALSVGAGLIGHAFTILEPIRIADILRYKANRALTPSWAHMASLLPSILAVLVFVIVGLIVWRRLRWPWLFLGSLLMFVVSGAVHGDNAFIFGSIGEIILALSLVSTEQRITAS